MNLGKNPINGKVRIQGLEKYDIDANINATVNFLQFWQDGYGILDEKWRIGTVAITDATLVFIVIGLTIAITYLSTRSKELNFQEEKFLHNYLGHVPRLLGHFVER